MRLIGIRIDSSEVFCLVWTMAPRSEHVYHTSFEELGMPALGRHAAFA